MNWKFFFFLAICLPVYLFSQEAEDDNIEEEIIVFDNKLILDVGLNYNEMGFLKNGNPYFYRGNRPFDLEFGMKYKNFEGRFNVDLPIKSIDLPKNFDDFDPNSIFSNSNSFDIRIDINNNKLLVNANFAYYRSFYVHNLPLEESEGNSRISPEKLQIISSGLSFLWNTNHETHAIKGITALDRTQTVSNGGFLAGFGVYYKSIALPDTQHYVYNGPLFGYSYIWIFKYGLFLNNMITGGINFGVHINDPDFVLMAVISNNLTFGIHLGNWSFTSSIRINFHSSITGDWEYPDQDHIYNVKFTLLKITKRF